MPLPGQWSVGQLYLGESRNGIKVWDQPGGIGTTVYPQLPSRFPSVNIGYPQVVMSYPSLYVLGCGHPSNCLEIYQDFDPYAGQQVCLECCPQCSFIQKIFTPASDYRDYQKTPIVVG
jgi:hypothetical protein